jgi:hypothetical protein
MGGGGGRDHLPVVVVGEGVVVGETHPLVVVCPATQSEAG